MKVWVEKTLGDLCSLITDGKHGDCRNEDSSGYYFISCKDVREGRIHYENARQIVHGDFAETHRRTDLRPGDVLLTNSGTIGRLAIAPDDEKTQRTTFQKSVAILKPLSETITSQFLYYSLAVNRDRLINSAGGAAQKNLLLGELRRFPIRVPSLSEQAEIASILSAYDNLIENNRRRIQFLEESARLLYREWFVHLRFPGYEHVKIINGVPEGWEKKPFSELATFMNGFAFKPEHLGEVGLPIVKIPELRDGPTAKTPRNTGEHISEKYLLENGDILFSWSGTLLVNIWNHEKGLLNQHLFKVTPVSDNLRGIVYYALKQALVEFQNQTTGSTMKHIRKGALEKVGTLVPNPVLLNKFESTVTSMLKQIGVLQKQTTEAMKARDLLLPRLMNGEIAI